MKLTDLDPRWFDVPGVGTNRDGLTFLCPCEKCRSGQAVRLGVQFANPVEGHPGIEMTEAEKLRHVHELGTFDVPPGHMWQRTGDTFDTMTLSPSVDASKSGHWHGCVRDGQIV